MFNNSWNIHIQKMQQWISIYQEKLREAKTAYEARDHTYLPIFDEYPIVINSINQGQKQSHWTTVKDVEIALEATQKRLETLNKMSRKLQINQQEYDFLKLSSPFASDFLVLSYPKHLIDNTTKTIPQFIVSP